MVRLSYFPIYVIRMSVGLASHLILRGIVRSPNVYTQIVRQYFGPHVSRVSCKNRLPWPFGGYCLAAAPTSRDAALMKGDLLPLDTTQISAVSPVTCSVEPLLIIYGTRLTLYLKISLGTSRACAPGHAGRDYWVYEVPRLPGLLQTS